MPSGGNISPEQGNDKARRRARRALDRDEINAKRRAEYIAKEATAHAYRARNLEELRAKNRERYARMKNITLN